MPLTKRSIIRIKVAEGAGWLKAGGLLDGTEVVSTVAVAKMVRAAITAKETSTVREAMVVSGCGSRSKLDDGEMGRKGSERH